MKIVMDLKSAAATAAALGVWSQVSIVNLPFLQDSADYSLSLAYSGITLGNAAILFTSFCKQLELFCEGLRYFTAL